MAQKFTITADLEALVGAIDFKRVQAAVITNLGEGAVVVDKTRKKLDLGIGPVPVDPDGSVTLNLLQTNATDTNVSGWRYWLEISAPEHAIGRKALRKEHPIHTLGPFAVTGPADLADLADQFDTPATSVVWRDAFVDEANRIAGMSADNARLAASMAGALSGVVNPSALSSWRAKLAAGVSAPKVVAIGDSITEGTLASAFTKTWPQQLQDRLRTLSATTGALGYVPATNSTGFAGPAVPATSSGAKLMGGWGLGGRALVLSEAGHHWTSAPTLCTKVRVRYGRTDTLGAGLKVEIDGVDQGVTLSSQATPSTDGHVWESPELPAGNHIVKITPAAVGFAGILNGVEFATATAAPVVFNAGHYGYKSADFLTTNMNMHWQSVTAVGADLAVVFIGANDILDGVAPATFVNRVSQMIAKIPASVPVLLLGGYLRTDLGGDPATHATTWAEYQAGLKGLATGRVAYLDLAPHWGTGAGLLSDGVHPNDAGMEKIADVVSAGVGPGVDSALRGPEGRQGLPGVNAVPAKAAVDTYASELLGEDSALAAGLNNAIDHWVNANSGAPSLVEVTITDGTEVTGLGTLNKWTVTAPVTLTLPEAVGGAGHLVHVDFLDRIAWPVGTEVHGDTEGLTEAWLSLVGDDGHWTVLVSSTGEGGLPEGMEYVPDIGELRLSTPVNWASISGREFHMSQGTEELITQVRLSSSGFSAHNYWMEDDDYNTGFSFDPYGLSASRGDVEVSLRFPEGGSSTILPEEGGMESPHTLATREWVQSQNPLPKSVAAVEDLSAHTTVGDGYSTFVVALGKPVWSLGATFVDASGTQVWPE